MIRDKVVIITGASSGIGEATAKLLASQGARIVVGARREGNLKQIVSAIEKDGGHAGMEGDLYCLLCASDARGAPFCCR
jgi:NADP-dependent 3-hydroxy acid dehydrogenase YdfG